MPSEWLRPPTELLVWALIAHVVADWLLQTDWMAVNKVNLRHAAGYVHAGVYTLLMLPLFPWYLALFIGVTHLLIDTRRPVHWWMRNIKRMPPTSGSGTEVPAAGRTSAYANSGFLESAVDQAFHVVVLAAAALAAYWLTL
ncbi:MAG: DUF3307 domain-containing protein [Caldilineaceae bacterium]